MKYSLRAIVMLLSLFVLAQIIGLFTINHYIGNDLPYGIVPPQVETNSSPIYFMFSIILATGLFFLFSSMNMRNVIRVWFFLAIALGLSITFASIVPSIFAVIIAILLAYLKLNNTSEIVSNFTELFIYGGIISVFVPVLNVFSAIILMLAISAYDVLSVFFTKHMIKLVKFQAKSGLFTGITFMDGNQRIALGGGDIAFSLLFAGVLLRELSLVHAIFALYGAAVGLTVLILIGKKKKFYPAMPFITAGSLAGFLISTII